MSEFLKIDVPGGLILTPATARGASKKFLIHHLEARTRYSTPESDMNFLAIPEAEWIVLNPEFDAAGDPIPPTCISSPSREQCQRHRWNYFLKSLQRS